ncbi:hypothetical protein [Radiobacillus sp. PE A8.2]|uniref:hypothetical protein n=1 Tax=Radiobacillus sp. PE A8.2 TaxID=3380349 RepID=UPI00388EE422
MSILTTGIIGLGGLGLTLISLFQLERMGIIQVNVTLLKGILIIGVIGLGIWLINSILDMLSVLF